MKKLLLGVLMTMMCLCVIGCKKSENNASAVGQKAEVLTEEKEDSAVIVIEDEEALEEAIEEVDFGAFVGDYSFSSGAGGWGTGISLLNDGSFTGSYTDSDMGDVGDDYPNGTVYTCSFSGKFTPLEKVDDYTYTAKLESLDVEDRGVSEEILDGVKYVYSTPYGFDDPDVFEFYLAGKPVAELSEDFLSWMSIRFMAIYPSKLTGQAFYNVGGMAGFEMCGTVDESGSIPASLDIDLFDLSGKYVGENGTTMNVSVYTDVTEGNEVGNYSWEEDPESFIYQAEGKIIKVEGNYFLEPEYSSPYRIVITNNTSGSIEFSVYSDFGEDVGAFKMVEHFES